MHARVVTGINKPGKIDELTNVARDSVLPAAKQQPGFKGWLVIADRDSGKVYSITLWETEDDISASEKNGYFQEQVAKVGPFLTGPPTTEHLEVVLQA